MSAFVITTHSDQSVSAEVHWGQLLTTFCCFHAGADEEYIYMNKVIVAGKDKDDKGEFPTVPIVLSSKGWVLMMLVTPDFSCIITMRVFFVFF